MSWVQKIALNELPLEQIEGDVQLSRIRDHIFKMKQRNFKPILYHGKMRVKDVELLEELRVHNRDLVKKKRVAF